MKTSEFKEALEKLGYEIIEYRDMIIEISNRLDECVSYVVAKVHEKEVFLMNIVWGNFSKMLISKQKELFGLLIEYTETPISERGEEKRYRLKSTNKTIDENVSYLNKLISGEDKYFLSGNIKFTEHIQNVFTKSELKEIDETGFERVEVTEW